GTTIVAGLLAIACSSPASPSPPLASPQSTPSTSLPSPSAMPPPASPNGASPIAGAPTASPHPSGPASARLPVRGRAVEVAEAVRLAPGPDESLFAAIPRSGGWGRALLDRGRRPRPVVPGRGG